MQLLLSDRIIAEVQNKAKSDFNVDLNLSLTCKTHFEKFIIPEAENITKQAVKDIRYAALRNDTVVLEGLKISGADWTSITSTLQKKCIRLNLKGKT